MKKSFLLSIITILFIASSFAQSVGIGTTTPNASSMLEIKSSSKGLLIPRTSTTSRTAIVNPAKGLMVYDTTTSSFWFHNGSAWVQIGTSGNGWLLNGNAGTDTSVNFIGTTDLQPLMFKVNNNKAGYIDFNATRANTGFGYQTLFLNTTGYNNTANGFHSLDSNTTGWDNTANGNRALLANTTGGVNTANGNEALYTNSTGNNNTANGAFALYNNTTGNNNTANGLQALYSNGTGNNNTANGVSALTLNYSGNDNTANGYQALYENTTGYSNVAVGTSALLWNHFGSNLVAIGDSALLNNGTGFTLNTDATENTAVGSKALYSNTTGYSNTANGYQSLYANTNGFYNTAMGAEALHSSNTAFFNTGIGFQALHSDINGGGNTAVGCYADISTAGLNNATAIGYNAMADASNKVRVGDDFVTSIGGIVGWTSFSDGRYKRNIKENVQGLAFINSLRPITYTVDINGLNEYYDKGRKHNDVHEKIKPDMQYSADDVSKIVYNGFIAQDVEAAAKKLNYNFSGVDKPKTKDGLYGLRYADFVVPLVKAVQEQQQIIEDLKKENQDQNTTINLQQQQINTLISDMEQLKQKMNPIVK